jgi:hypothetical protein
LGNYDAGVTAFNKFLSLDAEPELNMIAKYESAEICRRKNEYDEMINLLDDISKSVKASAQPMLLFLKGSTYLFDMKDFLKSKEIFEKLRDDFPALTLVYPGTDFVVEYVTLDIPPMHPDEMAYMIRKSWIETLIPNKIFTLIEKAAEIFVKHITEGVREIVILEEYDVGKGGYVTIDLTEARLNNYLNKWFPIGNRLKVWDVSMDFKGDKKLSVKGTIHLLNNVVLTGFIEGRFKIVEKPPEPYWDSGKNRTNFLLYVPEKAGISEIPLPKSVMNIILRNSIQKFNKNFPLIIEKFNLDGNNIVFAGPIREDLRAEIESEAYGLRHMHVKDADSGFIHGKRQNNRRKRGL